MVQTKAITGKQPIGNALSNLADRIAEAHDAAERAEAGAAHYAIQAGRLLMEAKELVPHGGWQDWLERNFSGSRRTAQVYMSLARDPAKAQHAALSIRSATEAKPREERTLGGKILDSARRLNRAVERLRDDHAYQPTPEEVESLRVTAKMLGTLSNVLYGYCALDDLGQTADRILADRDELAARGDALAERAQRLAVVG